MQQLFQNSISEWLTVYLILLVLVCSTDRVEICMLIKTITNQQTMICMGMVDKVIACKCKHLYTHAVVSGQYILKLLLDTGITS